MITGSRGNALRNRGVRAKLVLYVHCASCPGKRVVLSQYRSQYSSQRVSQCRSQSGSQYSGQYAGQQLGQLWGQCRHQHASHHSADFAPMSGPTASPKMRKRVDRLKIEGVWNRPFSTISGAALSGGISCSETNANRYAAGDVGTVERAANSRGSTTKLSSG